MSLESDEIYAEEDEGYGGSPRDYEQWQSGDLEHGRLFFGPESVGYRRTDSANERDSLLGDPHDDTATRAKRRLFGRGQWNAGRIIFFVFFYFLIGPLVLVASVICWLLVVSIPMGRVILILRYHLRRHPLALSFHSAAAYSRSDSTSSILLCAYRAVGIKYWKYTIDGANIVIINLLAVVLFTIVDFWFLGIVAPGVSFCTCASLDHSTCHFYWAGGGFHLRSVIDGSWRGNQRVLFYRSRSLSLLRSFERR